MSADKDEIELDDAPEADDGDEGADEVRIEGAKANLTKRRIIDNLLEERRLQKQLLDYDFDL
jgi:hypothetical protein